MAEGEAELLARWRQGEEDAFAQIVRRWEQPLARFLGRLADQPESVSDLMQETFLRLHRAGARYHDNGHFSTWLFQIALNVARDAARRRRPTHALSADLAVECPAVADAASERESATRLRSAIAELPVQLREVLALRHDRGMSFEAMSRMLNVPASTLKSRFSTALQRVRKRLKDLS